MAIVFSIFQAAFFVCLRSEKIVYFYFLPVRKIQLYFGPNLRRMSAQKKSMLPDRTFHNFGASQPGHGRTLCSSETSFDESRGSKL